MKTVFRNFLILLFSLVISSHYSCFKNKNLIEMDENEIIRLIDVAINYSTLNYEEKIKSSEEKKETVFLNVENKKIWESNDTWIVNFEIPVEIESIKSHRIFSFRLKNSGDCNLFITLADSKKLHIGKVYSDHITSSPILKDYDINLDKNYFRFINTRPISYIFIRCVSSRENEKINVSIHDVQLKKIVANSFKNLKVEKVRLEGKILDTIILPPNSRISYLFRIKSTFYIDGYLGNLFDEPIDYKIYLDDELAHHTFFDKKGWIYFRIKKEHSKNNISKVKILANGNNHSFLGNVILSTDNLIMKKKKNSILYLVDALRGDYGGIPFDNLQMSKIFKDGLIFTNAYSNATQTIDSIPTIFTGKYSSMLKEDAPISEHEKTLAEFFRKRGFITAAFIANPWLIITNSHQGFDYVFYSWSEKWEELVKEDKVPLEIDGRIHKFIKNGNVLEEAADFISKYKNRPFFIFIHTMETHAPYILPQEKRMYSKIYDKKLYESIYPNKASFYSYLKEPSFNQIECVKRTYMDNVIDADNNFKKFHDFLVKEQLDNKTCLVLTSDHGERLYEHNSWAHGKPDIFNEVISIPLMIKYPGSKKIINKTNVQLIDLYPTFVHWILNNNNLNKNFIGTSLFEIIKIQNNERILYFDGFRNNLYSFILNNNKLIFDDNNIKYFNLLRDPLEKNPIVVNDLNEKFNGININDLHNYRRILSMESKFPNENKSKKIKKEDIERLKALGYLK